YFLFAPYRSFSSFTKKNILHVEVRDFRLNLNDQLLNRPYNHEEQREFSLLKKEIFRYRTAGSGGSISTAPSRQGGRRCQFCCQRRFVHYTLRLYRSGATG